MERGNVALNLIFYGSDTEKAPRDPESLGSSDIIPHNYEVGKCEQKIIDEKLFDFTDVETCQCN